MKILISLNDFSATHCLESLKDLSYILSSYLNVCKKLKGIVIGDWCEFYRVNDLFDLSMLRGDQDTLYVSMGKCRNPQDQALLYEFLNTKIISKLPAERDENFEIVKEHGHFQGRGLNFLDDVELPIEHYPYLILYSINSQAFDSENEVCTRNDVRLTCLNISNADLLNKLFDEINERYSCEVNSPNSNITNDHTILREKDRYHLNQSITSKNHGKQIFEDLVNDVYLHLDPAHAGKPNQFEVYNKRGEHIEVWNIAGEKIPDKISGKGKRKVGKVSNRKINV